MQSRRIVSLVVAAIMASVAVAAMAFAQSTAPPELAYSIAAGSAPTGPSAAAPGPTTFVVSSNTKKELDFTVVKLHPGADPVAVQAAVNKRLTTDEIEAMPFDLVGGTSAETKGHPASFRITLVEGTYMVVNTTSETKAPAMVLTVSGPANGAVAPTPATQVSMFDYKYELNRSIPRSGAIRVINKGKRYHMMIALKAANAKGAAKLSAALRKGASEKVVGSLIRGGGTSADPISPGQTIDLPAVHYGKGSYVFACFWSSKASKGKEHIRLGMTKIITVK